MNPITIIFGHNQTRKEDLAYKIAANKKTGIINAIELETPFTNPAFEKEVLIIDGVNPNSKRIEKLLGRDSVTYRSPTSVNKEIERPELILILKSSYSNASKVWSTYYLWLVTQSSLNNEINIITAL